MAITKEIGKIASIGFGIGGYQDAMFGLSIAFSGKGWGVSDFIGTWATWQEGCKWTVEQQNEKFLDAALRLKQTLEEAGKADIRELEGIPVEVTFEDHAIRSWRVLTEVL